MVSSKGKLLEISEINHELLTIKEKQKQERNRLNLSITWTGGSILCLVSFPFIFEEMKSAPYIFGVCAIIGLPFLIWAWSRLNNTNQEIKSLEKRKKELRNSVR